MVIHRPLALGVDFHAASLRHGETGFGLEERDVDRLRLERGLDHVRGRRERRVHVSA